MASLNPRTPTKLLLLLEASNLLWLLTLLSRRLLFKSPLGCILSLFGVGDLSSFHEAGASEKAVPSSASMRLWESDGLSFLSSTEDAA
jgi:hypothetical protein